jgi:uncharacterized membrane protein/protein-disulfide isomerase
MTPIARRLGLLFALLGLASSSTSLYVHHKLLTQPGYSSPCDINATFGCSNAYLSPYGSLYGIPVALFGVVWFLFVVILLAWAGRERSPSRENVPAYLFVLSTIGLAVVLYLGYAAFFVLREVCLFCLITYLAVIGLFITSGVATSVPMTSVPRRAAGDLRRLATSAAPLVIALLFLLGTAAAFTFFPRAGTRPPLQAATQPLSGEDRSDFDRYWDAEPRLNVPVSSGGALVSVVKFTDFQCPQCGQTYFEYRPIFQKYESLYPGAVRFVSKNFPLDTRCNPAIGRPMHAAACEAAAAYVLAREHHREAEMEEWLYTNQMLMTPASVKQAAATVGHVTDFEKGYERVQGEIRNDVALGQVLSVGSTPTFFVNGVKVVGRFARPEYLDLAIQYELKKAGKLKK